MLVHIFLKLRKWRGDFQTCLPNYVHDKLWKNVILPVETNFIQRLIKYYHTNMVANHNIIPFYSTSNHKSYLSVLLYLLPT